VNDHEEDRTFDNDRINAFAKVRHHIYEQLGPSLYHELIDLLVTIDEANEGVEFSINVLEDGIVESLSGIQNGISIDSSAHPR
jgi:hypothetical protein